MARKREIEIEEFAKEIGRKWYNDGHESAAYASARQGALWVDDNPKSNLIDIKEFFDWIKSQNMFTYMKEMIDQAGHKYIEFDTDKFIENIKQAMEK